MSSAQDDERPTASEMAARVSAADRQSGPQPERLRFQWNVPRGVKPHIPCWLSMLFLGVLLVMIIDAFVRR
jgi:hypothetical protein